MTWLLNLLTGLPAFLQGILPSLLSWLNKKEDTTVDRSNNAKEVATAAIASETARQSNVKDIALVMMSHPIFWVAWGVGVFPVLLYHASVYWVSTFPFWGWVVHKVPAAELAYGQTVISSVFMLTGASTLVAGIVHAWNQRA
jgi:hypothetical protein